MRLDHPGAGPFGQHRMDLFFGDSGAAVALDAEQPQQRHGRESQQPDERLGGERQPVDRPGHHAGQGLGIGLADSLRHQFAEHDREIGDRDHDQAGRQRNRRTRIACPSATNQSASGAASADSPTIPFSTPIDVMPIWIVDRNRVGFSPSLAAAMAARSPCVDQLVHPRPASRDERDLRHREDPVQQDQRSEYGDFHLVLCACSGSGRSASPIRRRDWHWAMRRPSIRPAPGTGYAPRRRGSTPAGPAAGRCYIVNRTATTVSGGRTAAGCATAWRPSGSRRPMAESLPRSLDRSA